MLATSAYVSFFDILVVMETNQPQFAACPYEDLAGQDLGVISNFAPKVS
jgi:hypothetical protein